MKATSRFLRITAFLIAVIMMASLCLVSCDEGETADTTVADATTAAPDPDNTTAAPAPDSGEVADVKTAAGVADLINASLADVIPTAPAEGEGESSGNIAVDIGAILDQIDLSSVDVKAAMTELLSALSAASISVSNINITSASAAEGAVVPFESFSLSNNFIVMKAGGNKAIGKITADGFSMIMSSGELVMADTPVSFEKIYAPINQALSELQTALESIPDVSFEIDLEAIKAALTVDADDLIDLGNGVWQLKATYVVDAIKVILAQFGMDESALAGSDINSVFDLILMTNMTADLSKYNENGELTVKLDIPQVASLTVFASETRYTLTLDVASQMNMVIDATQSENEVNVSLKVSAAGQEIAAMTIEATQTETSVNMDASLVINAPAEDGSVAKYEVKATLEGSGAGFTYDIEALAADTVLIDMNYTVAISDAGVEMSLKFEDKVMTNSTITITAKYTETVSELHYVIDINGEKVNADLVMNPTATSGEFMKASVSMGGADVVSLTLNILSVDANGAPTFNLALVTPEASVSCDISFAPVAAPELSDAEKAAFDACDRYLAGYSAYMAQLADYDAKVDAAVAAGKTLGGDFALIDKTNPNVVYRYHVFSYSETDYEVFGNIEFALDTTGYNVITEADLAV